MFIKYLLILSLIILNFNTSLSQDSNRINITGYVETYYCYDLDATYHNRSSLFYNFNRHDELSLNLGLLNLKYNNSDVRGNLGLMVGTYPQNNLSSEQTLFQNIYEANVGVNIDDNLWIDAGIMPSHIGFESAIGQDNWTLTRSIGAENSPYFETGLKLSCTSPNNKLFMSVMYLNGWQNIRKSDYNNYPSIGTQITYTIDSNSMINWSTYIGNQNTISSKDIRYYNNLYGIFRLTDKFKAILGLDIGYQSNIWYCPTAILQCNLSKNVNVSTRLEYYSDVNSVIIPSYDMNGSKIFGYSINFDYWIKDNTLFRIEGRYLNGNNILQDKSNNTFFTTSLSIKI